MGSVAVKIWAELIAKKAVPTLLICSSFSVMRVPKVLWADKIFQIGLVTRRAARISRNTVTLLSVTPQIGKMERGSLTMYMILCIILLGA